MKKILKKITFIFTFVLFTSTLFIPSINFKLRSAGGINYSIRDTFSDIYLAQDIATFFSKSIDDILTQEDINRFTGLNLNNSLIQDLSGIEHFVNLQDIFLQNLSLTHLPDFISDFPKLQTIYILSSSLEELPDSIGNSPKLRNINIHRTNLTKLPDSIVNLSTLDTISISYSKLKSLPDSIGNLNNLIYLFVLDSELEYLPDSVGNLSALQYLYLNNNNLSYLPESVTNIKGLQHLHISNNSIRSLPVFKDTSASFEINASLQEIYLPPITLDNNSVMINTIITGFSGENILPSSISNSGSISNDLITWENLERKNQTLSYSFSSTTPNLKSSFSGTVYQDVVVKKDINDFDAENIVNQIYTGYSLTPEVKILDESNILISDDNFDISYSNNIDAGIATVILTGKKDYTGTKIITFEIVKAIPQVSSLPIISNISSNENVSSAILTDGKITGVQGEILNGTFSFKDPSQKLINSSIYEIVFTPDNPNYESLTMNITFNSDSSTIDNVNLNVINELPKTGGNSLFFLIFVLFEIGFILIIFKNFYEFK